MIINNIEEQRVKRRKMNEGENKKANKERNERGKPGGIQIKSPNTTIRTEVTSHCL
jgi:hypothetical protein